MKPKIDFRKVEASANELQTKCLRLFTGKDIQTTNLCYKIAKDCYVKGYRTLDDVESLFDCSDSPTRCEIFATMMFLANVKLFVLSDECLRLTIKLAIKANTDEEKRKFENILSEFFYERDTLALVG